MRRTMAVTAVSALLPLAAGAQERGGFLLRAGNDTLSVEQFTRGAEGVTGRLLVRKRLPVAYQMQLRTNGTLERLTVEALQPDAPAETPPRQTAILHFRGDSVIAQTRTGDSSAVERFASRPGALAYHGSVPIISLLEQIVRRARRMGGDSVRVPVFVLSGRGATVDAAVHFASADSARVTLGTLNARLHVDAAGRLLGGTAQGTQTIERLAAVPDRLLSAQPVDYSAPPGAPYRAEEVRIPTAAGHVLAGTLTVPAGARGPVPAVVTITGSSPQDRDNNGAFGGPYRLFRQVADTLGRRGVAVLRLDDRGIGQSTGDFASSTTADRANDIRAALAWLRARPEIDRARVALVGLSEGGLIAPMIAADDASLRGMVLMAAPASTGRQVTEYQVRAAAMRENVDAARMDSVVARRMRHVDSVAPTLPWERFFVAYDPVPTARRVARVPVLILHGTTDRNVPPEDAAKLAAAFRAAGNRDVTVRMFAGFNHVFLPDPNGHPQDYGRLTSFQVPPEVLGPVADWLAGHLGR